MKKKKKKKEKRVLYVRDTGVTVCTATTTELNAKRVCGRLSEA